MAQIVHPVTGGTAEVPDEALLHWRAAGWLTAGEHAEHQAALAEARAQAEADQAKAAAAAAKGSKTSGQSAGKTEE